jgi:hypothetical protein
MKLYYYTDFTVAKWAESPKHWRALTGRRGSPLRSSHNGIEPPKGYVKTGHLAHDGATPTAESKPN